MGSLSSTVGIVALAAAALAVIACIGFLTTALAVRRLRGDQRAVLGASGEEDLVAHAAALDTSFVAMRDYVEDVATRLDTRLGSAEAALHGAVAHRGLVRFDAYNEMSGRQSVSLALLDASGSGIVLTSIHHRDQARLYAKQVIDGRGELELSPEEQEAVRLALAGELQDVEY
jgi:Protein of unknown function (DUF4446)